MGLMCRFRGAPTSTALAGADAPPQHCPTYSWTLSKVAFPGVDINRLFHNMRKRGIPKEYIEWMKRCLAIDNRMTLSF